MAQSGTASSAQPFSVKAAVDAYLAKIPPAQRARSDAYFEGGYWLLLWDFLSSVVVMWMLLRFRWSVKMRDLAERVTRFQPLQTFVYWVQFIVLVSLITFPLTVYEGFFREHKYDLSNQTFGAWMRDQAVALAVTVVLGGLFLPILFGLVRRLGKNRWVWGAVVSGIHRFDRAGFHLSPV
jgi:STE24 endopeptidase